MIDIDDVAAAISGALVGEGDDAVVDFERLEQGLTKAGIECTATTNRGALTNELSFIREERRVMQTRADNAEGYDRQAFTDIVERIDAREQEVVALLWG